MGAVVAHQPTSRHFHQVLILQILAMQMNKALVMLLVSCLLLSLILPAIEAASTRRARGRARPVSSRNRKAVSSKRRSQARALRARNARRRGRTDLPDEITEENAVAFDAEVVEDDSATPSVDGFGDVCEAVMFNKDGDVISFQFLKNKCE